MYADDVKLFATIRNVNDAMELQNDLNLFSLWCSKNLMQLNISKCKCMSYTMKHDPVLYNYSVNNVELERVFRIRDL